MTKIFNPKDWLAVPEQKEVPKKPINNKPTTVVANDIETYINALEQSGIDITDTYEKWRDIGFAISEEYGEAGRDYYHRISRNYSGYDHKECDEQYNKCLQAKGHGISIATLYHHLHQVGIKPKQQQQVVEVSQHPEEEKQPLPTIPTTVYNNIPTFLQQVVKPSSSNEERDILLLGALTAFSACFPKLFGIYDQRKVFCNLYLFVTAPASAGKGRLNQIKNLVVPITILVLPILLVVSQPDLGTAIVMMTPLLPMLYWAGARPFYLFLIIAPIFSMLTAFQTISFTIWAIPATPDGWALL